MPTTSEFSVAIIKAENRDSPYAELLLPTPTVNLDGQTLQTIIHVTPGSGFAIRVANIGYVVKLNEKLAVMVSVDGEPVYGKLICHLGDFKTIEQCSADHKFFFESKPNQDGEHGSAALTGGEIRVDMWSSIDVRYVLIVVRHN